MKFQLLFFIVLAIVATFIATESEAAPSKEHGNHRQRLFKASDMKLLLKKVHTFLQNGKGHEDEQMQMASESMTKMRAIENPGLLKLVEYLSWLSEKGDMYEFIYELSYLGQEPLVAFYYLEDYLESALEKVDVDVDQLIDDYYLGLEDPFYTFIDHSDAFWKKWVDEPDRHRENLLVFIPQIQEYLRSYGTDTFNYFQNLVNLSQALMTSDVYAELLSEVQGALDKAAVAYDDFKAALAPPSEIVRPPTNITLESFLGLLPYLAELNVSSILLDGFSTAKQVQDIRHTFNDDLVALLGEASADLEIQGRNVTENFEAAVDMRHALNRLNLDNWAYAYFYGAGWDSLYAFADLIYGYIDGLTEIPPISVDTILQLVALVETTTPEYQERVSELVTQALQKTDAVIKNYFEVFKAKETKH